MQLTAGVRRQHTDDSASVMLLERICSLNLEGTPLVYERSIIHGRTWQDILPSETLSLLLLLLGRSQ